MNAVARYSLGLLSALAIVNGCGKVKEVATEVNNEAKVEGHWLMTESEHSGALERALENESVVLTFNDGKAAFSPTDSVMGQAVYATIGDCNQEVRPYRMDKEDVVFEKVGDCAEKRTKVQTLTQDVLKLPDPDEPDTTRTFKRITEEQFNALVKASDRKP